jgi:hypothetical protein
MDAKPALVFLLIALTTASLAQTSEQTEIGNDPQGDVTLTPVGAGIEIPNLDLLQLSMSENEDYLQFKIEVAALEGDGQRPILGSSFYEIYYSIESAKYRAVIERTVPLTVAPTITYQAVLEAQGQATAAYQELPTILTLDVNEAANTIGVGVPWEDITNQLDIPVNPNDQLSSIFIVSKSATEQMNSVMQGTEPIPYGTDRLPDSGYESYTIQRRGQLESSFLLESNEPLRSSNGAATTFLYPITVTSFNDNYGTLEATSLPEGWRITPVDDVLELQAGIPLQTSVILQTTMAHIHGGQELATLTLNIAGEQVAVTEIGILYTDTPQPTAHHSSLTIHAFTPADANPAIDALGYDNNLVTMNTTVGEGSVESAMENTLPDGTQGWRAHLNPGLGVGLHFTGESGHASVLIAPTMERELQDIKVTAKVILELTETVVLRGTTTIPSITTLTEYPIELLSVTGSLRHEYDPAQNLILQIEVDYEYAEPGAITQLKLYSGTSLELPLLEYQDVPTALERSLKLSAPSVIEAVNPGESRLIIINIESKNSTDVQMESIGLPKGWTTTWSKSSLSVQGATEVSLLVTSPINAVHGTIAPFYVKATPADGPASVVPLQVRVDDQQELENDTIQVDGSEATPPIPIVAILTFLGIVASKRK